MGVSRRQFLAMLAVLPGARRGEHQVYEFRGSAYQVGLQHGRALAREIRGEAQPAAEALARRGRLGLEAALKQVRSRYEGLFRERMPAVLEEIHGMAERAELSYDYAFFAATRDMMHTGACTAIAAGGKQTSDGGVLIGQTKDTGAPLERFRIMRIAYASGRRMVVLNYPGWIANMCLTSDGLSCTGNSLFASPLPGRTIPGSFLQRLVLEKASIGEVLDAIRGRQFENGCLLIADASGHAVCVELATSHTDVREISGEAIGHANNILTPGLKRYEEPKALGCTNTRYPEAHPRSGGGSLAVEVRDEGNQPIAEFSGERRARHHVVSPGPWETKEPPARWPVGRSLVELKGRRIRLMFLLRDSRLFSFRA
jgi:hypothetical protein